MKDNSWLIEYGDSFASSTLDVSPEDGDYNYESFPETIITKLKNGPLASSEAGFGQHRLLLDVDCNHMYVPSSTPGHGHLYFDNLSTWEDTLAALKALATIGIVSQGWVAFAEKNHRILLRKPSVKKGDWARGVVDALIPAMLGARLDPYVPF